MPYHFAHIQAYYANKAKNDTTTFGKWDMLDRASWYSLASNR